MRKLLLIIIVGLSFSFSGCIKNELPVYTGKLAEIDATTWNANGAGLTYAVLTRVPADGRVVGTSAPSGPDSTLRRYSGTVRLRINLVGPQSDKDETVGYSTFSSPVTSVSFPATLTSTQSPPGGQTPAQPAATLAVSDAVAGTHYAALSGTITIPAHSSFGYLTIQILNPGPTAGQARFLGIQLNNNGSVKANVNYSQVGLIIDQR